MEIEGKIESLVSLDEDGVLPLEIIQHIFSYIDDVKTFGRASCVNHFWKYQIELIFKDYCKKLNLLDDEGWWLKFGKDWKWVVQSKLNVFKEGQVKNGVGSFKGSSVSNVAPNDNQEVWIYEGEWVNDRKCGVGHLRFSGGRSYKGTWKDDIRDGYGRDVFVQPNSKSYYEGEMKDGMKHGKGMYVWESGHWKGDSYSGEWNRDFMEGFGRYNFASGAYYEGEWKADCMHGRGVYHHSNGNIYEGELKSDVKDGSGKFFYAKYGSWYEGHFSDDTPHGNGVYTWKDRSSYVGEWFYGRRRGHGVLYQKGGRIFEQRWEMESVKHPYLAEEPNQFPPGQANVNQSLIEIDLD